MKKMIVFGILIAVKVLDMLTFKSDKLFKTVFLLLFFIYVVSPLTTPLSESKKYLTDKRAFKAKDVSIFLVDFLRQLVTPGGDADSSQQEDENVIVKKKRAVLRGFERIEPLKTATISYEISNDLSAHDYPHADFRIKDHKSNSKAFKGFLPLYSGVSPPIV